MTLLARILSHGFAIAIVLLLAIGLIYRGKLFPEYQLPDFLDIGKLAETREESTPGELDRGDQEPEEKGEAAAVAESRESVVDTVTPAQTVIPEDVQRTVPEEAVEMPLEQPADAVQPPPVIEPAAPVEEVPAIPPVTPAAEEELLEPGEAPLVPVPGIQESTPPESSGSAVEAPLPEEDVTSTQVDTSISAEPEFIDAPQETGVAEPVARPQANPYQLLAAAREAYWLRDYDTAESNYLQLTRADPGNPDGYGELGNMYFSQGNWEQAATAYFEAGSRLVAQGLLSQAEEMVAVIRGLNGAHADDLERQIADARSTTAD